MSPPTRTRLTGRSSQLAPTQPVSLTKNDPHPTKRVFGMPLKMMRSGKRCEPFVAQGQRPGARGARSAQDVFELRQSEQSTGFDLCQISLAAYFQRYRREADLRLALVSRSGLGHLELDKKPSFYGGVVRVLPDVRIDWLAVNFSAGLAKHRDAEIAVLQRESRRSYNRRFISAGCNVRSVKTNTNRRWAFTRTRNARCCNAHIVGR